MANERRWTRAIAEHERVVAAFGATLQGIPDGEWGREPAPGRWSAASVALHVCRTYELGRDATAGARSMRPMVPPAVAWVSRRVILPFMLATERFPRGAAAPREVLPDAAEASRLTPHDAVARLTRVAGEAATALRATAGSQPSLRFEHAYFGSLDPWTALRLLSAHTRHHTRGLATRPDSPS